MRRRPRRPAPRWSGSPCSPASTRPISRRSACPARPLRRSSALPCSPARPASTGWSARGPRSRRSAASGPRPSSSSPASAQPMPPPPTRKGSSPRVRRWMPAPRSSSSAVRSPGPTIPTPPPGRSPPRSEGGLTGRADLSAQPKETHMSWLTRVRNAIPFLPKRETPDNLWHKCPQCEAMVFTKEYEENLYVCPRCEHHGRIGPKQRFALLLDPGYTVLAPPQVKEDPLKFRDSKRYTDRIKAARSATGEQAALLNARGAILGHRAVMGVQDFAFMGGSMGMAVGAAFVAGARAAIEDRCPYLIVTAAGGARMQEGILS